MEKLVGFFRKHFLKPNRVFDGCPLCSEESSLFWRERLYGTEFPDLKIKPSDS